MIDQFKSGRRRGGAGWIAAAAAAVVAVLFCGPVLAQAPQVFEVEDVRVDITAETAAAAREQALAAGEVEAFRRLIDRIVVSEDRDLVPDLDPRGIAAFVKDLSVAEEKTSAVRYLANLTYRFRPEVVRDWLLENGISFVETPSKPVLVLPVYRTGGTAYLWDEPNPWFEAWRGLPPTDGLVPLVLPLGDLTDVAAVGAEQAVRGDLSRLSAAADRYGAGDTLVAVADSDAADGGPDVQVSVTRYGSALEAQTLVFSYAAAEGEQLDALLSRAAADLTQEIETAWKRDNKIEFGDAAVMAVTVPVSQLPDWLTVRDRLESVAIVQTVEVVLLSRSEVRVNLHYFGDPNQLTIALEQADLTLSSQEGETVLALDGGVQSGSFGSGRP